MTDPFAALLAEAADLGAPVARPGPELRDRARRRWRRQQVGAVVGCVLAVASVALVGVRLGYRDPQPPETYARTGPASAAALAAGHWEQLPAAPIAARTDPVAVWTGSRLLVWGGADPRTGAGVADGAAYDPATHQWQRLPASPLRARSTPKGVWTGSELVVWGGPQGTSRDVALPSMAAYDPRTGAWRVLARPPVALRSPAVVWDGRRVVVAGLDALSLAPVEVAPLRARALSLDPVDGRWTQLPDPPLTHLGGTRAVQAAATTRGVYLLATWAVQEQTGASTYTGQADQQGLLLEGGQWRDAPAPSAAGTPRCGRDGRCCPRPAGRRTPATAASTPGSAGSDSSWEAPGGRWPPDR